MFDIDDSRICPVIKTHRVPAWVTEKYTEDNYFVIMEQLENLNIPITEELYSYLKGITRDPWYRRRLYFNSIRSEYNTCLILIIAE